MKHEVISELLLIDKITVKARVKLGTGLIFFLLKYTLYITEYCQVWQWKGYCWFYHVWKWVFLWVVIYSFNINSCIFLCLGFMALQFGFLARLTWWEYSWDIMEPVTYFVTYATSMLCYGYFVLTREVWLFRIDLRTTAILRENLEFLQETSLLDWLLQFNWLSWSF